MVKHLYNSKDVSKVREQLLEQQGNLDLITNTSISAGQAVLDHDHDTQFVRAVLHRQTNVMLGKIENAHIRYIKWWYEGTLSDFLRGTADYLDKEHDQQYLHPSFIKHLQVQFNKLNEKQKQDVLSEFNEEKGCNGKERKLIFKKFVLKRTHSMQQILEVIEGEED